MSTKTCFWKKSTNETQRCRTWASKGEQCYIPAIVRDLSFGRLCCAYCRATRRKNCWEKPPARLRGLFLDIEKVPRMQHSWVGLLWKVFQQRKGPDYAKQTPNLNPKQWHKSLHKDKPENYGRCRRDRSTLTSPASDPSRSKV